MTPLRRTAIVGRERIPAGLTVSTTRENSASTIRPELEGWPSSLHGPPAQELLDSRARVSSRPRSSRACATHRVARDRNENAKLQDATSLVLRRPVSIPSRGQFRARLYSAGIIQNAISRGRSGCLGILGAFSSLSPPLFPIVDLHDFAHQTRKQKLLSASSQRSRH